MKTIEYAALTPKDCEGIVFWGEVSEEELHFDDIDEAIEAYLDQWLPEALKKEEGFITMGGFVRRQISENEPHADWFLEQIIERLDEEYGSWSVDNAPPTQAMKDAAEEFAAVIRREYKVWQCEDVLHVTVPVRSWVETCAPDWLKEDALSSPAHPVGLQEEK